MNKKKVPYNTQVQFAIMAGKSDEAHDVIGRALAEMGNGALEFAQSRTDSIVVDASEFKRQAKGGDGNV